MSELERFVIQCNIDKFTTLLAREIDPVERCMLEELLAEEEAKWQDMLAKPPAAGVREQIVPVASDESAS
jgi:hypothetical protein